MGIRKLLSTALPKASNFYISYFILQGLALSASRIVHLGGIVRHQIMRWTGARPRLISRRYHRLRKIHWGSVFPMFTNMGVIGMLFRLSCLHKNTSLTAPSNNLLPHRPPDPRRSSALSLPRLLHLQIQLALRLLFLARQPRNLLPPGP